MNRQTSTVESGARWAPAALAIALVAVAFQQSAFGRQGAPGSEPARITVIVPADAALTFDGDPTSQTGSERLFITPALPPGKKYAYIVVARWKQDGKPVERQRKVSVRAGARVRVDLTEKEPVKADKIGKPVAGGGLSEEDAQALATEAYIYGYPLVTMEMTRRVMTNVAKVDGKLAPMGQFANLRAYPSPSDMEVTAPNADTLYSLAWLDLSKEPYVLSIPDADDRYFLMPMLDGYTEVFQVPGKRTTGTKAQKYLIAGPGWKGEVPEGVTEYRSPTALVWILGRTYCTGTPEDYKKVHAFQDKLGLVPLSSYGKDYTPPAGKVDPSIDMKTPVREQVDSLGAVAYFTLLAKLLEANPPAAGDAAMVAKLAKLGIEPGKDFDAGKLDLAAARGLQRAPKAAQEKIMAHFKKSGVVVNGWMFSLKTGLYGTDYLQRAFVTAIGLGANRPQDAVYPTSDADSTGKPYDGSGKYTIHFAKGETPPVNAFWSITMYDASYFFVPNPLNKFTVSPRNNLKLNGDGSLDLYIQNESPGKDREANWLPAPKGRFILMMRTYWPSEKNPSILDGTWKPPAVVPAK